ncbi:MAG: NAD(P)/FAD-dependent oxidoreductase [Pleurocapsa sp.]
MNTKQQKFDAIVIGSGIGGLTVAALLSKIHQKRVLVLEQHFKAGGFTHTFKRKKQFHWDVGLHYVGEMYEGSTSKALFDYLTDGNLRWQKMPDPFEKFVYPDFTFEVFSDPDRYQADLIEQFPQEASAIKGYFADVKKAVFWFGTYSMLELLPTWLHPLLRKLISYFGRIARQTTEDYLASNFQDERLKALLTSQWGDYGLAPSQSCFGIHSLIVTHYLKGGWYPVGGSEEIAKNMIPVIESSGGAILTKRRVSQILLSSGVAVGVEVENTAKNITETYSAPIIVSDVGAFNTYLKLIPPDYPLQEREQIEAFPKGNSVLTVYLGLKESPEQLGFKGENHWIYNTYNHEEIPRKHPTTSDEWVQLCYLSFPSLKDPLAEGHTAEIIAYVSYDFFEKWREQPWMQRGTDYTELKNQLTNSLLNFVEARYPGFRNLVEYTELSTPLTVEYFDASDRGAIYGIPCTPERFDQTWIGARTPIKNLYLTGTDAFSPGIMGAMMGGVKTAGLLDGAFGFFKIMKTAMQASSQNERVSGN